MIGASGGIGQPLSLLLKMNTYIKQLSLYDAHTPPGAAVDLSHINTPCHVMGLRGEENLYRVLQGSDIVIVPAGVPRKPGMTRDDLFECNAKIAVQLASSFVRYCPEAIVLIISNPINSLIPLYDEVYRRLGINADKRLIGMTNLDSIRAATFVGEYLGISPHFCSVPVVGGHAGTTIVPIFSQLQAGLVSEVDVPGITKRVQFAGDEVVNAKEGNGSATLAMAYAAASFTSSVLRAMDGEMNIIEPGFIRQRYNECDYFASQLRLGMRGVEEAVPLPRRVTCFEKKLLREAVPQLVEQAEKGIEYAKKAIL